MKKKAMKAKLTFKKETVSNLELGKVSGGKEEALIAFTKDYSQCGTGPATIVPCMCDTTIIYTH